MAKHYLLVLLLAIGFRPVAALTFFVAPTGNDSNSGSIQQPFLTIQRAQTAVAAGDTVYVRGGTYLMQNSQIALHFVSGTTTWSYVTNLTKSGTAGKRINYWAYPGEQPVFNYSNLNPNANTATGERVNAFEVSGSYIYLRGLEVVGVRVPIVSGVNTQSICFSNNRGNNNIYERLSMHDGQAIGFYLTQGANTLILNCDAYRNNDNTSTFAGSANGGNVDGFGCHPSSAGGTGNVFRGCRAWQNSDDGYDCINAYAAVVFENCWAFYNGYTQNFVARGDGNGFKAGGYGTTAYTALPATAPSNTVRFCMSVRNRSNGFYANHHLTGDTWYNNTAYQNAINYSMVNRQDNTATGYQVDVDGYDHVLRNNVSLLARSTSTTTRDIAQVNTTRSTVEYNTFPYTGTNIRAVATSDFISLDTTHLRAPRQADGSLPLIQTLRLAPGSSLIDAGTSTGFPAGFFYNGAAPDLGAFEFATLWTGAVSTDWFASGNWTGDVPAAATDALIPLATSARYPVVSAGTAVARALTVSTGATLEQRGGTLSLMGNLTNNGTWTATGGTLATSGSVGQNIGGSSPLALQSLTIGPAGAMLGTPTSFSQVLTLLGDLTTNGQPLQLMSSVRNGVATDGLVVNSGGVVVGKATVQRAIDPSLNPGLGYRHFSAPVSNTTVADLATSGFTPVIDPAYNSSTAPGAITPFPTVYGYDESRVLTSPATTFSDFDKGWYSPASLTEALVPAKGYTVNIAASQLVDFVGTLNNGTITQTLSLNGGANGGWQLLGNPYPSPLDWRKITVPSGLGSAIYVVQSTAQFGSSYRSYVNGVGNPILPVAQGFFVRSTGPATLSFTNAARVTTTDATTFQRTAETRPLVQLTLHGSAAPALADELYIYFENGATAGVDAQYDALKIQHNNGGAPSLFSLAAGTELSINGLPALTASTSVPLSVAVPTAGTYTFEAAQLLNLTAANVYLVDAATGQRLNLQQQPTYTFRATAAALLAGRFSLLFEPASPLATAAALTPASVGVYPNPTTAAFTVLVPAVAGATQVQATLLNSLGQEVARQTAALPPAGAQIAFAPKGLAAGIYTVRVQAGDVSVAKRLTID